MALGDVSTGTVSEVSSADTLLVDFTSGAHAGDRYRVRALDVDAFEPEGPDGFVGRSAVASVGDWLDGFGRVVDVTDLGLDQYGRLVGQVVGGGPPFTLSQLLIDLGVVSLLSQAGSPPTVVLERSEPRVGLGNPADLVVDTTKP